MGTAILIVTWPKVGLMDSWLEQTRLDGDAESVELWRMYLGLSWLGFEHPAFRLRGERTNQLRHSRGLLKWIYV